CGSFPFDITAPGGPSVATAGLTAVGVLPTHRRRGVLTTLMRRYLDDVRRSGQPLSGLFASGAAIYGRFGYGMAALGAEIEIERQRPDFSLPAVALGAPARVRLVSEAESAAAFPVVWNRVRLGTPGMLTRSDAW